MTDEWTRAEKRKAQSEQAKAIMDFVSMLSDKITELEKENAELIQENEEMKKGLGCETCQIHLEYMRLNDKIRELGKENAGLKKKLKEKLKTIADKDLSFVAKFDALEKENAELEADNDARKFAMGMSEKVEKQLREQLTKARELLKRWVELYKPKLEGYPITPIQEQTEQFLKEIEK